MPTVIYMPLRSNAAWFGDVNTKERLVRQLKANLILYDRVLLQDGRYLVSADERGQGMQSHFPGNSYPGERTKINYCSPGERFGVAFKGQTLLNSSTQVSYEVDFLPIIAEAGLGEASCIHWCDYRENPAFDSDIRQRVAAELHDQSLCDLLPCNPYIRKFTLESLYRDAIVAKGLCFPFSVDHNAFRLIDEQKRRITAELAQELPSAVFRYWLNLRLPDVTNLSWPEVYDFRESDAGVSFRSMVHRIAGRVSDAIGNAGSQQDVDEWVKSEFSKELLEALGNRVKTPGTTAITMILNFIPFGSVASMAMDTGALVADQSSWVSLVRGYKA